MMFKRNKLSFVGALIIAILALSIHAQVIETYANESEFLKKYEEYNQANPENNENLSINETVTGQLGSGYSHECLNLTLEKEKQLDEFLMTTSYRDPDLKKQFKFIAGDCKPIVMIAGLYATKLMVEFTDCDKIEKFHPSLYNACFTERYVSCKKQEKLLWMTEDFITQDGSTCFAEVLSLNIKKNKKPKDKTLRFIEEKYEGFRVTFFGDTAKTKPKSKCGLAAGENILDKFTYFGRKTPVGFYDLNETLVNTYGYTIGANLFGIPHDWRDLVDCSINTELLKGAVETAYVFNRKKVLLVAHSLGSLVTYEFLSNMTEEFKKKYIDRVIMIGPPLLGVMKAVKNFIFGTNDLNNKVSFIIDIVNLFLSIQNQKILNKTVPQPYQMLPNEFWKIHENADFMKALKGRINIENKITECVKEFRNKKSLISRNLVEIQHYNNTMIYLTDDADEEVKEECFDNFVKLSANKEKLSDFKKAFPIFPDIDEICYKRQHQNSDCHNEITCVKTFWDERCRLNMFTPFDDNYFLKISYGTSNFQYDFSSKEQTKNLLRIFQMGEKDEEYNDWVMNKISKNLSKLDHPKVRTVLYFLNSFSTEVKYDLKANPKEFTDRNEVVDDFIDPKSYTTYMGGDGTVPTGSMLAPFLKWSKNKDYSTHLIHFCTTGNLSIKKSMGKFENEYQQIKCTCKIALDETCTHSSMITDKIFINHLTENYIKFDSNESKLLDDLKSSKTRLLDFELYFYVNGFELCRNLESWDFYKKFDH